MKAFEFFEDPFENEEFPEDLAKIIDYLQAQGTINITLYRISDFYRDFCDECYCAGWLGLSDSAALSSEDQNLLDQFARWLSKQEI